jgi:hypothetical protein
MNMGVDPELNHSPEIQIQLNKRRKCTKVLEKTKMPDRATIYLKEGISIL